MVRSRDGDMRAPPRIVQKEPPAFHGHSRFSPTPTSKPASKALASAKPLPAAKAVCNGGRRFHLVSRYGPPDTARNLSHNLNLSLYGLDTGASGASVAS